MRNTVSVSLKDVSVRYDKHSEVHSTFKDLFVQFFSRRPATRVADSFDALTKINLDIEEGQRVGIIGLNGAGKSTLLKVIGGIIHPTSGEISISGNVQPLIEIGAGFNPEFSGRENIYLNGAMIGYSNKQLKQHEQDIIDFAELEEFIDVPIKYYSSGMIIRLAFTVATMIQPEILLLDEMLSAGDIQFIDKAKRRMSNIVESARILIVVSHDLGLVEQLTTETHVLKHGRIVFSGPTPEAIKFYRNLAGF